MRKPALLLAAILAAMNLQGRQTRSEVAFGARLRHYGEPHHGDLGVQAGAPAFGWEAK